MTDVFILDEGFQHDPFPALAEHRRHDPVFEASDMPVWLLTRYEDVGALRNEDVFSVGLIKLLREAIDGPNMIQMDGADHHDNRAVIAPAFRPRVLNDFARRCIEAVIGRLLAALAPRGEAELMREFCEPLAFFTIADLLGLAGDDQPHLSKVYKDSLAATPLEMGPEQMAKSMAAKEEITRLLTPIVDSRRAQPTDDFVSQLVTASGPDGGGLDDEHVLGFLRFMLPAGEESTTSALGTTVYELLAEPERLEKLRHDRSLVKTAVEEGLRWRAPVAYINRLTLAPIELSGVTIPEGALVLGAVNAANRDESVFSDPDTFDITRDPNRHMAFGTGVHTCIGAPLSRLELQMGLSALIDHLP
ncbi:MAG: cytochrome P450, partial [Acidimicrobiia bacterium]